jgi:hypothetical protein
MGVQLRKWIAFASLCLMCVLGTSFRSDAQSTALPMGSHPIEPTDWSFECFYCLNGPWITTQAQPGTVRLWMAGTEWAFLDTGAGNYDWSYLDTWLDLIAEHQPRAVIYTFGLTPCWISSTNCDHKGWGSGHNYTVSPPKDLTSSGSLSFNAFVTALVRHCSPAGNCVKDYIAYWEMWNEANITKYWTGTATQLYDLFAPVIPIIRNNIPNVKILTPPVCGGDGSWMASWMTLENTKGRLSDYYSIHLYLKTYSPEQSLVTLQRMLRIKNANGWTNIPWLNTETNFALETFTCSPQFSREDCRGQLVRWHVMQYALQGGAGGAIHVGWFNWEQSIPAAGYDTYYYTMMQWLIGSTFTASCTTVGTVWTCPLVEASGAQALIVWDAAGPSQYRPASEYVDYRKFNGTYGGETVAISSGKNVPIEYVPIMLETAVR